MKKRFILFVILLTSISLFAQKSGFTLDDIYKVKGVGAPALSPSNKYFVYTLTNYVLHEGKSRTEIHLFDIAAKQDKLLIGGGASVFSPFWGIDDNTMYYSKSVDGFTQIFAFNIADESSKQITHFYSGANSAALSPDGRYLAFSSEVYPECGADQECLKKTYEAASDGPVQAYLADELLFRHWNVYSEGRVNHIILFDLHNDTYKDIAPYDYNAPIFSLGGDGFVWSPESEYVCYVANPNERAGNSTNADLWLYDLTNNTTKNITRENLSFDGDPLFSPDGRYIAYRTQKIPNYESDRFRIALYDLKAQSSKIITEGFDNWVSSIEWASDSKNIFFTGEVLSYLPLYSVNITTGNIEKVSLDRSIGGFQITDDNTFAYYSYRLMNKPADIYRYDLKNKMEEQLTFHNTPITEQVDFRPAQHYWIAGSGGKKVDVLLVTPHNFDPSKKYPLIVNVHGGPQSQWMDAYRPDAQVYSGYGYIVAFPNPHGSTGYGQDYTAAISGDWGGKVYEDIMLVTDSLAKLPFVDADRIGAMGWSYGGYFMNWLQAKTTRFKCLASMMGLYDINAFYGTTEELWFPEWDMKGAPWENPELYQKYSPSNYVQNFSTPTLIITGEKDYRVSYTQSLEYFTALKKKGIDSRIIIFKNDGHWPNHVRSMPLYYNAHLEWFHKYLGGAPAPYDSKKMVKNLGYD